MYTARCQGESGVSGWDRGGCGTSRHGKQIVTRCAVDHQCVARACPCHNCSGDPGPRHGDKCKRRATHSLPQHPSRVCGSSGIPGEGVGSGCSHKIELFVVGDRIDNAQLFCAVEKNWYKARCDRGDTATSSSGGCDQNIVKHARPAVDQETVAARRIATIDRDAGESCGGDWVVEAEVIAAPFAIQNQGRFIGENQNLLIVNGDRATV